MTIGEKIKEVRKNFDLSQYGLAEKLNVSRQAITKWETGEGLPDTENLKNMSKLFGVSIDYLLNDEENTSITILKETLDMSEFGDKRANQLCNILEKYFKDCEIYSLHHTRKYGKEESLLNNLLLGMIDQAQLVDNPTSYLCNFLIKKNDKKYLVYIDETSIQIQIIPEGINTEKKFVIGNEQYKNMGKLKIGEDGRFHSNK